ncbi:MAG: hypothetical protein WC806_05720 [Candidatus Gracilibacteria bacterium]|jgi:hypothetical protein
MRYLQVIVPQGDSTKKKEKIFEEMISNFHNTVKDEPLSLEILGFEQYSYFFITVPDDLFETLEGLFYSTYPDCEIKESSDYFDTLKINEKGFAGSKLKFVFGDVYPFKTFDEFEEDSQSRLFSVISKSMAGEKILLQMVVNPKHETAGYHLKTRFLLNWNRFKKFFSIKDRFRIKDENSVVKQRSHLALEKSHMEPFSACIRLGYIAKTDQEATRKLEAVINSFYQFNKTDIQEFRSVKMSKSAFVSEYKQGKIQMILSFLQRKFVLCITCLIRILCLMLCMCLRKKQSRLKIFRVLEKKM